MEQWPIVSQGQSFFLPKDQQGYHEDIMKLNNHYP